MSIIVNGMEMPKGCFFCPLVGGDFRCRISHLDVSQHTFRRHSACTLVEIPSWHGDLIDRDALPPVTPTQRTGKWIHHGDYDAIECSLCGAAFPDELSANYCPSCGAKMEAE